MNDELLAFFPKDPARGYPNTCFRARESYIIIYYYYFRPHLDLCPLNCYCLFIITPHTRDADRPRCKARSFLAPSAINYSYFGDSKHSVGHLQPRWLPVIGFHIFVWLQPASLVRQARSLSCRYFAYLTANTARRVGSRATQPGGLKFSYRSLLAFRAFDACMSCSEPIRYLWTT